MFWRPRHDRIIHNVTRIQFCPTYWGSFVRKLDPSIFTAFSIYYPPELIYFCVSESAINSFDLSLCYSLKYSPHERIFVIQVCHLDQVVHVKPRKIRAVSSHLIYLGQRPALCCYFRSTGSSQLSNICPVFSVFITNKSLQTSSWSFCWWIFRVVIFDGKIKISTVSTNIKHSLLLDIILIIWSLEISNSMDIWVKVNYLTF